MFFERLKTAPGTRTSSGLYGRLWVLLAVVLPCCGGPASHNGAAVLDYKDGEADPYLVAQRFAPVLCLHASEPYDIVSVFAVLHPYRPFIAYHVFFEHDAVLFGGGDADHEIVWVQYDPVSLKAVDVSSLWHRTVIRTQQCLMDARASGQRPTFSVQWGQHGMLPLGWESLVSVRPRLEVLAHYSIVHDLNRVPGIGSRRSAVAFDGTYEDYVRFDRRVDSRGFIPKTNVLVAEFPAEAIRELVAGSFDFKVKKEWPDW